MPVLELRCSDCGHEFRSLVMEGTKVPEVWVCSACGSRRAHPFQAGEDGQHRHPFDAGPGESGPAGCPCCG